jgi:glucosamine-6-phosphate deaminase
MNIKVFENPHELGTAAGVKAAGLIKEAIKKKGAANIILATGTSQFETLNQLISENEIDWSKVSVFHLDEYIGLPVIHPASFRKYLQDRFISKVPQLKAAYLINGETDVNAECKHLSDLINDHPIDVALVGIGENSHLAFNDPPADFETDMPYIIVELDEACRKQQLGEGWFSSVHEVPPRAISMSVKQIMKSGNIICSVPGKRKATAVKNSVEHSVSNLFPATILQLHHNCILYLDKDAASLLSSERM